MASSTFMVITDQNGAPIPGESTTTVFDPYSKSNVAKPAEIAAVEGETENTFAIGSGGGGTSGKIVFDPCVVTKAVDLMSQATFAVQASGVLWRFVDILVVKGDEGPVLRPYLSYRLGTVGVADIRTAVDGETAREVVSFVSGQFQIGYQFQKPDGTRAPFAPVGWDRVRNVRI